MARWNDDWGEYWDPGPEPNDGMEEDWIPPQRKESLAQPRSSSSTQTPSAGEPPTTKQDNKSNPRQYAEELKKQWPATFWRLPQEEDGPEAEGDKGQGAEAEEACEEEVASRILDPAREEGRAEEGRAE